MSEEFSKAKLMVFPRKVLVGHGVIDEVGALASELGFAGKLTVVTGHHTRKIAGDRAREVAAKAGFDATLVEVVGATGADVAAVERSLAHARPSVVLGVGGGSVIDAAKLGAAKANVPYISVPTSASHDGITSPRASIKDDERVGHASREAMAPLGIVADTEIIARAPYRMLAAGCADAISNSTAVLDWKLAHRLRGEEYSSFAAVLAETAADLIMENADSIKPGLEESAWIVVKSLIVSGVSMSVAGSSRPASGAEHMFSHTLDELAPGRAYHGEQVGLGAILMMYLHGGDWRRIRDSLKKAGAPTTAAELGIPRDVIVNALMRAHRNKPDRYTILGDNGLTRDAAEELLKATGVA
ncbi:MAG: NAD(P)-dependent glycerol-1-phosphate dehydrogenase [Thermoplasmatota archaeon]